MSRNFEFRASPQGHQRGARFVLAGGADIPNGAPVTVDTAIAVDGRGLLTVKLATGAQNKPANGMGGIIVYEGGPDEWGSLGRQDSWSDLDTAPVGATVQVVSGDDVKVAFTNTAAGNFYVRANYPKARVMVAGAGATPTVAVGDFLTPGTGNDSAGYWVETANAAEGWLVVTGIDVNSGLVEAQFCF